MTRPLTALIRLVRAALALASLAGFTIGVPWVLVLAAGWPLQWLGWTHPDTIPNLADLTTAVTNPWSDEIVLALLATCGWMLWALFVRDVIIETLYAVADAAETRAGHPRPSTNRRGPLRWAATMLIGAILGTVLLDAARAGLGAHTTSAQAAANAAAHQPAVAAASAFPTPTRTNLDATRVAHTSPGPAPTAMTGHHDHDPVPAWAQGAPGGVHHVVKGDNLWDIAKAKLGNPYRWREIYKLNRGHTQANGHALTDPDMIHIGWVLAIPAREPAPASPPAADPEPAPPSGPAAASPTPDASAAPSHTPASTPSPGPSHTPTTKAPHHNTETSRAANAGHQRHIQHAEHGVDLPTQGWITLGLATAIATVSTLVRLHTRRRASLAHPIPVTTDPQPSPVPTQLTAAEIAGRRRLKSDTNTGPTTLDITPTKPRVPAPIGVDRSGAETSLFNLPGPGLALMGDGAEPVARAILAAALTNGVLETADTRPLVVTTTATLARLIPDGHPLAGIDPEGTSFDGERLIVLPDIAAAVTHAEEEMICRRRLLDRIDANTVTDLNARPDLVEHQPPYVLLTEPTTRQARRISAIGTHRHALDLHPIILGPQEDLPTVKVNADGTPTSDETTLARLSTLTASDLAGVLAMIAEALPRPEPGTDIDDPSPEPIALSPAQLPAPAKGTPTPVSLRVLGPTTVTTAAGPVTTGMRSGSYAVLALLAAHPDGRTLEQITTDLHPDAEPENAVKRVRTDITTARRVLRAATARPDTKFIIYDGTTERYRLDPETIDVDLWRMLTAIDRANTATDDASCLAALRQAADLYGGDFADSIDRAWAVDYATSYRHQILGVYARIAELLEADHPDQATAALETAIALDPVNEELYQRVMRIHGRLHRPDAVRRTLRQLENHLAELACAEPSEATRRVAQRQLRPTPAAGGGR